MYRRTQTTDWLWAHALDLMAQAERTPPVDIFIDGREAVIVVALPGVSADRIEITSEPGALVVRAERALPVAATRGAVRQLEIPHGRFERRIPLPEGLWEAGPQELTHGCLVLRLRRAA